MPNHRRYTLEEAAAEIGFRVDDLAATLPDAGIDIASPGHEGGTLSEEEVAHLRHVIEQIKQSRSGLV